MNIYKLYAVIGPWTTPAPAAIALSAELYGELIKTGWLAAWSVAIFSLVALEVVGALSTKEMIYSTQKKEWTWFLVALLGVILYAALGVYALWGMSAWIYVILAVFVHIAVTRSQHHSEQRVEVVEDRAFDLQVKQLEVARDKERTKQLNAEARKEKARQPEVTTLVMPARAEERDVRTEIFALLDSKNPECFNEQGEPAIRAIARKMGIAPSTSKKHVDMWKKR